MATQVSGIDGNVSVDGTEIENVRMWTINLEFDEHGHAHSDSSGWEETTVGVARWDGEFMIEADEGKLTSALWTALSTRATATFSGTSYTGQTYSGSIKLLGVPEIGANIEDGTVLTHTWRFKGSGALTPSTT